MQEQELFQGYEVKNWDFNPRIYKILAASAVFNVLALLVVGQTNLLTTKGCDSPLVGGVCQVLDTLVVGGTVLATDRDYINADYTKTELEDAEIIWVDRTGDEKFKYPENYFALANPELAMMNTPTEITGDTPFPSNIPGMSNIPGIPNPTTGGGGNLLDKKQVLPPANKDATTGTMPDSPFVIEENPTVTKPGSFRPQRPVKYPRINQKPPKQLPNLDGSQTANKDNKQPDQTKPDENKVEEVVINKKPMKDLASLVKTKYEKKEIDLSQNFKVVAEGVLTKDGKLDVTEDKKTKQPKSRILLKEGNPEMIDIASQAITAIGDSGWLSYLRNQGVEKINFTVVQDNNNLQVIITSDFPKPETANTVTSALNFLIKGALIADQKGWKTLGEDEKVLLNTAKVVVNPENTKQFVLNVVLPKATALDMITRKLKEPQEPSTNPKPNGNTGQITENKQATAK
jgi:hypothetical protein